MIEKDSCFTWSVHLLTMFRCAPCITSLSTLRGFSHDDSEDTASYLTMAAKGIHECTMDSFFTVNVPKENDYVDFSNSFSEIGADFSFGLKCDNIKQKQSTVFPKKKELVKSIVDAKYCKLSKTKQKYIVNESQEINCHSNEKKIHVGNKLKVKFGFVK